MPVGYIDTVMCLPPPFLASLKSKSTFHCSISRICESKDKSEAEYNDEAEDTEATNDNSGKKRAYAETKHGDKTIKIRINKLGATTVQKRIDKCKCDVPARVCHGRGAQKSYSQ